MAGDEILDAIDRADAMGARSTLSLWMRENHDGFAARLAVRRADWTVLAALFEKAGLTDGEGKTASAETARKTWHRVRQHMARVRAGLPGTSPEPAYIGQTASTSAAGASGSADLPVEPRQPERAAPMAAGDPAVVASHPPARPRNTFTVARFKRPTEEPT